MTRFVVCEPGVESCGVLFVILIGDLLGSVLEQIRDGGEDWMGRRKCLV